MKKLCVTVLAAVGLLAALSPRAHATYVLTLQEVGSNVVGTGTGSMDTTLLTLDSNGGPWQSGFLGSFQYVVAGVFASSADVYTGVSGSFNLGTADVSATGNTGSGTGDIAGLYGNYGALVVPHGYVSGSALSGTFTLNNVSFSSLGFTPGTYTYTWGTGANADSLTVTSVVPEPSTWALLGLGAVGAGMIAARRRAA